MLEIFLEIVDLLNNSSPLPPSISDVLKKKIEHEPPIFEINIQLFHLYALVTFPIIERELCKPGANVRDCMNLTEHSMYAHLRTHYMACF
jgi:hypothetical protein